MHFACLGSALKRSGYPVISSLSYGSSISYECVFLPLPSIQSYACHVQFVMAAFWVIWARVDISRVILALETIGLLQECLNC